MIIHSNDGSIFQWPTATEGIHYGHRDLMVDSSTAQVAWAKGLRDALAPYTTGRAYANFVAADEADRVRPFRAVLN